MPFIPHTDTDVAQMLQRIGADSIDTLFEEIPANLRCRGLDGVPPGRSEAEVARLLKKRAAEDSGNLCFLGAGAYDHHIPAAVWEVATRGEFYSAYTPYQAEASQGTLQVIYEFQSMMTSLTAMDASNASLYDGASALAEAVLTAVRLGGRKGSRKVLVPASVHPVYRRVVAAIVHNQGIELVEVPYDAVSGRTDPGALAAFEDDYAALVIPQPNFFGVLEEVDALTDWAAAKGMLTIALVNPLALALLKPPGRWGSRGQGADIACGEGQPLGIPIASGGPYFGFMCCKQEHVRQMPGRIVGRTVDLDGNTGFTLTLQAREQHIRRSKATSNICTNQGLMVTAATIHMAILGPDGLKEAAAASHRNTVALAERVTALGLERLFDGPFFHEVALRAPVDSGALLRAMGEQNILAGVPLEDYYPELANGLLVCATEKRVAEDIDEYAAHLERSLTTLGAPERSVQPQM